MVASKSLNHLNFKKNLESKMFFNLLKIATQILQSYNVNGEFLIPPKNLFVTVHESITFQLFFPLLKDFLYYLYLVSV